MSMLIDLVGKKFGRLTVLRRGANSNTRMTRWICKCDCGNETLTMRSNLKSGTAKSCGCFKLEKAKANIKHGFSKHSLYNTWLDMKMRCHDESHHSYATYGGRGISVCNRWLGDFGIKNFIEDMGEKPGEKYSIDRIDNDKSYSPANCRWATPKEQANNRSTNVLITFNGKTKNIAQWARHLGMKKTTLNGRLNRGWDVERALTERIKNHNTQQECRL